MHAAPESAARPDETGRGPWTGLSDAEALARLAHDGPNELPRSPAPSPLRQLVAQLVHFFALMLWAAGALAIVGGMPELGVAQRPAGGRRGARRVVDRDGAIVCRVSPEDKLRIARALQTRGHVLAMTGDGVNDGPALEQADIGIAMGRSGTDVARDASDLVLLDDDFATIVLAIEQGRATFTNLRRSLTYHLTDNVAELAPFIVWALSAGRVPLALGVLQILFLDLLTDQLPALALAAEAPEPNALDTPPLTGHLVDRALLVRALAVLGPTEAIVTLAAFGVALAELGSSLGVAPEASVLRVHARWRRARAASHEAGVRGPTPHMRRT